MNEKEIISRIQTEINQQLDLGERKRKDIHLESTLTLEELGADSLDVVEVCINLEESFDVNIPEDEFKEVQNIGSLCRLFISKIEEKNRTQ